MLTIWWGTGNNVQIRSNADTWRRILPIRLESPYQNPETRTDVKHPDLPNHVKENRQRYLWAALVLLRGYFVHGLADEIRVGAWGSYPGWSKLVRAAVVWLGLPDPYKAHEALTQVADSATRGLEDLVMGWKEMCEWNKVEGCTARDALDWLAEDLEYKGRTPSAKPRFERLIGAIGELCSTHGRPLPDVRALGYILRSYRGRVVEGHRLDAVKDRKDTQIWTVIGCSKG